MNAHARSSELPELSLVDDAAPKQPTPSANAVTRDVATDAEPDLASLPTLPRFPAKRPGPPPADAANAAVIAPRMELALEPLDDGRPASTGSWGGATSSSAVPARARSPAREGDTMPRLDVAHADELPASVTTPSAATRPPSAGQPSGRAPLDGPTLTPAAAVGRSLAEATLEFDAGQIDQPLWTRAVTQADGDEAAARAAYLKARATAIRIARREARHERAERRMRAMGELHGEPRGTVHARGLSDLVTPRRIVAALATAGALVATGAWFALRDTGTEPVVVAAAKPAASRPAATDSPRVAAPDPAAAAAEKAKAAARELADKVAELSAAGNWNVLVLHASEWTRKDPDNPDAWLALGTGYTRLKQHYEAAEALARAAALAPDRPETWRALGEAKAAWGAADEALAAYERAIGMDDRDIASLVEMGRLLADKGDLAGAKGALDRALALNAADVEALCAAASVAQKGGLAKDAQAYAQKAKSLGAECPAAAPEAPPVRVVGGKQPPATPASTRR